MDSEKLVKIGKWIISIKQSKQNPLIVKAVATRNLTFPEKIINFLRSINLKNFELTEEVDRRLYNEPEIIERELFIRIKTKIGQFETDLKIEKELRLAKVFEKKYQNNSNQIVVVYQKEEIIKYHYLDEVFWVESDRQYTTNFDWKIYLKNGSIIKISEREIVAALPVIRDANSIILSASTEQYQLELDAAKTIILSLSDICDRLYEKNSKQELLKLSKCKKYKNWIKENIPDDKNSSIKQAILYFQQEKVSCMLATLDRVASRKEIANNFVLNFIEEKLGFLLFRQNWRTITEVFEKIISLRTRIEDYQELILYYNYAMQYDKAIALGKEIAERFGFDNIAVREVGIARYYLGEYQLAIEAFGSVTLEQIRQQDHELVRLYDYWVKTLSKQEKLDEAISLMHSLIGIIEDNPHYLMQLNELKYERYRKSQTSQKCQQKTTDCLSLLKKANFQLEQQSFSESFSSINVVLHLNTWNNPKEVIDEELTKYFERLLKIVYENAKSSSDWDFSLLLVTLIENKSEILEIFEEVIFNSLKIIDTDNAPKNYCFLKTLELNFGKAGIAREQIYYIRSAFKYFESLKISCLDNLSRVEIENIKNIEK